MKIRALHNRILATHIERGEQKTKHGIIIPDDNGKERGIRARWMQVYAVGPDIRDIIEGQWIFTEHGRWSRGMIIRNDDNQELELWSVDPEAVLLTSDENPFL